MNRKNRIALSFIIFFLLLMGVSYSVVAMGNVKQHVLNLTTDKDSYYKNEVIYINATWEHSFDPVNDIAFFQIRLFNVSKHIIWNSSKYYEMGRTQTYENISLSVHSFIFINNLCELIISLYYYCYEGLLFNQKEEYFCNKTLNVVDFPSFSNYTIKSERDEYYLFDHVTINISYTLRDSIFENSYIRLKVFDVNNSNIYNGLKTNNSERNFSMLETIDLSSLNLTFINKSTKIKSCLFYHFESEVNSSLLEFYAINLTLLILEEKDTVYLELLDFTNKISKNDDIIMNLYYYYIEGNCEKPLREKQVYIELRASNITIFDEQFVTNNNGENWIQLPYNVLNDNDQIDILIYFNETEKFSARLSSFQLNVE